METVRSILVQTTINPLGGADCEGFESGWLVQPVNAWSSLFYSVVGVLLIVAALRLSGRERTLQATYGTLLVVTGIGSFLYHGPQTPLAHFAHDISFLMALWALALLNVFAAGLLVGRLLLPALGAVFVVLSALLLLWPESTNYLTASSVIALIGSDLVRRRTTGFARSWYAAAVLLLFGSLLFNALGRTGAPTCDPDALFQYHGLWHLLTAFSLGAYFLAALPPSDEEPL